MSRRHRSAVATHLLRIGAYVAAGFWLAFAYAGWELVASAPGSGQRSPALGWTILGGCFAVVAATVSHWVKYLRYILGGLTLGALLAVADGHLLNSSAPFSRLAAGELAALSAASGLVSHTLAARQLTIFDRVALVGFVAATVGGGLFNSPQAAVFGLALGFAFLFAAWAHSRRSGPRERGRSSWRR